MKREILACAVHAKCRRRWIVSGREKCAGASKGHAVGLNVAVGQGREFEAVDIASGSEAPEVDDWGGENSTIAIARKAERGREVRGGLRNAGIRSRAGQEAPIRAEKHRR